MPGPPRIGSSQYRRSVVLVYEYRSRVYEYRSRGGLGSGLGIGRSCSCRVRVFLLFRRRTSKYSSPMRERKKRHGRCGSMSTVIKLGLPLCEVKVLALFLGD
jgi:hypothetical protein